jgi:hypothetical protein
LYHDNGSGGSGHRVEWSVFKAHVWTKKAALLGSADAQIEALRLLTSVATEQYGTFSMKLAYSPIPEAVVWAGKAVAVGGGDAGHVEWHQTLEAAFSGLCDFCGHPSQPQT